MDKEACGTRDKRRTSQIYVPTKFDLVRVLFLNQFPTIFYHSESFIRIPIKLLQLSKDDLPYFDFVPVLAGGVIINQPVKNSPRPLYLPWMTVPIFITPEDGSRDSSSTEIIRFRRNCHPFEKYMSSGRALNFIRTFPGPVVSMSLSLCLFSRPSTPSPSIHYYCPIWCMYTVCLTWWQSFRG